MRAGPLGLRLFLEGVEVPVISAQVSSQPSQPAAATIQIVPLDSALEFLPRTCVHLFYLDELSNDDVLEGSFIEEAAASGVNFGNRIHASDASYKVLFIGEVIGYNYSKAPDARQLILQCMDLSSYWDACYQWFADYSAQGDGLTDKTHTFVQAGEGLFDNIASGHDWTISRLLSSKPLTPEYSNAKGLQGGMIHLLEAIGGLRPRAQNFDGFSGANDFFTIAELRYNLLGMLGAVEDDHTSTKVFAAKSFIGWLQNGMTSMGSLVSFRDIIRHVGAYIFHDIYPVTSPYFTAGGSKSRTIESSVSWMQAVPTVKIDLTTALEALILVKYTIEKLLDKISVGSTVSPETFIGDLFINNFVTGQTNVIVAKEAVRGSKTPDKGPVVADLTSAEASLKMAWQGWERIKTYTVMATENMVETYLRTPIVEAISLIQKTLGRKATAKKNISIEEGAHLFSQLLLPETYFIPPPRCNVLFPDQYYSFTYNRNFMREVTRLSCHSGLGILAGSSGSKLLGTHYFAPAVRGTNGKTLYATLTTGAKVLLPHEIHSGVIPKFEWVVDGHRWGVEAAESSGNKDQFYQAGKVGYIQRLAHFQFYQHRWMSRSMAVEAKFNPRLVLGLSAIVIDRPAQDFIVSPDGSKIEMPKIMPTQYIGKIMSLVHNVSQGGGMTSVAFTHCRTHRGRDDEFLNLLMKEKMIEKPYELVIESQQFIDNYKYGGKSRKGLLDIVGSYLIKDLKPEKMIAGYGKVTSVTASPKTISINQATAEVIGLSIAVFKQSLSQNTDVQTSAQSDPNIRQLSDTEIGDPNIRKLADSDATNANNIRLLGDWELSDPNIRRVNTETAKTAKTTVDLPIKLTVGFKKWISAGWERSDLSIEDALMPGWYSDVWKKKNLSTKVYLPLLGCLAITDDSNLANVDMAGLTSSERAKAVADSQSGVKKEWGNVSEVEVPAEKDSGTTSTVSVYEANMSSIEQAVDSLALIYGLMKFEEKNVHQFIDVYTYRPIASMENVMGSQNLDFDTNGLVKDSKTMIEGFHSRAFGDYNADMEMDQNGEMKAGKDGLKNFVPGKSQENIKIALDPIINRGETIIPIPPTLDPRGRARKRVKTYQEELSRSRGFYGG